MQIKFYFAKSPAADRYFGMLRKESSNRAARIVVGCFLQEVSSDHSNHGVFDLLAELVHMSGTQGNHL